MATEQAVDASRTKRGPVQLRQLLSRFSSDTLIQQGVRLPEEVYQVVLGTESRIRGKPEKYNIGQLSLQPRTGFDPQLYQGRQLQTLEQVEGEENIATGVPYIARGFILFDDEANAILATTTGTINLGPFGSHAQRLLSTATQLQGREMVLPVVLDEITDEGMRGRAGEQAAYLEVNPNWWKRQRVRIKQGDILAEGLVEEVDPDEQAQMVIQTPRGRRKKAGEITFTLDEGLPIFDEGTTTRPTAGESVDVGDRVRVKGKYVGLRLVMTGPATLQEFSTDHMLSYEKKRQDVAGRLHDLELVLTDENTKSVRQGRTEWHLDTQEARETVARYLFAQLRQEQHLLLPAEEQQMWELIESMDPQARPMIFADDDPRHKEFDIYFAKMDKDSQMPRLSEAMTPAQFLDEMMLIAARDTYPPALETMIGIIRDYPDDFPQDAGASLVQYVFFGREEQLRQGENPSSAIHSLWETLPYLPEQGVSRQADWLAHMIHAGVWRYASNPKEWKDSADLHLFMKECLRVLGSTVYTDQSYSRINHQALFALLPYYIDHLSGWPQNLPYGLGREPVLEQILRDLTLVDMGSTWQQHLALAGAQPAIPDDLSGDDRSDEVLTGLRSL